MISNKSKTVAHKASKFLFFKLCFPFSAPGPPRTPTAAAVLVIKFRPPTLLCVPPPLGMAVAPPPPPPPPPDSLIMKSFCSLNMFS